MGIGKLGHLQHTVCVQNIEYRGPATRCYKWVVSGSVMAVVIGTETQDGGGGLRQAVAGVSSGEWTVAGMVAVLIRSGGCVVFLLRVGWNGKGIFS